MCVLFVLRVCLKKANELERDLTFQRRSSTQCVPMFHCAELFGNGKWFALISSQFVSIYLFTEQL